MSLLKCRGFRCFSPFSNYSFASVQLCTAHPPKKKTGSLQVLTFSLVPGALKPPLGKTRTKRDLLMSLAAPGLLATPKTVAKSCQIVRQ